MTKGNGNPVQQSEVKFRVESVGASGDQTPSALLQRFNPAPVDPGAAQPTKEAMKAKTILAAATGIFAIV